MSIPNKKIRVLYVIDKMVRAGAQRHLVLVLSGLDRSRYRPVLCCLLYKGPLADEVEKEKIPVESLHLKNIMGSRFVRAVTGLSGIVRRHRIDLIHSYLFSSNIVSPVAGFFTGRPVITSRRDTGFWKARRHLQAHRICNAFSARITANSPAVVSYLLRREKARREKIALIHNGIGTPDRPPGPTSLPAPRERFIIGALGNIRPIKGYEYLLEAAGSLPPEYSCEVRIAGRILDRDYLHQLENLVRRYRLEDRVSFRGEVEDVEAFLRELHIFVLPSLSEGFSNSLLEAMAGGRAVIATTVGGNQDVINNGVDGLLVPPGDVTSLSDRLRELMDSPSRISSLGEAARRRVANDFSVGKMCYSLQELYLDVVKEGLNPKGSQS